MAIFADDDNDDDDQAECAQKEKIEIVVEMDGSWK